MKKTIIFGLCVWLLAIGKAAADNTLSVANVTVPRGGQATIEIVCSFSTAYVGGQLDLELPDDGKVTPIMLDGKPVASFGFTNTDHSISSSQLKNTSEELLPKYRFIFTSMSSSALPSSGTLMRIVLNASETATEGNEYNVKLSGIELGTANSDKTNITEVAFTITIGSARPKVTLYETSTVNPTNSDGAVDVTVNRTIKANEWSTICLPFDMTETQIKEVFGSDVQLADFDSWSFEGTVANVETIKIVFSDVTAIDKNHPYIIKVSEDIENFIVHNATITNGSVTITKNYADENYDDHQGQMIGTRKAGTVANKSLFLANNKFYYSNGSTNIKAFRATFNFGDIVLNDLSSSRITMSFNDNESNSETTAIKSINTFNNGMVYNLNGQQVKNPANGIYVKDGKKVIIK